MSNNMIAAQRFRWFIVKLVWFAALAGTVVGGFIGFVMIASASGPNQQAAGAAIACLVVIVPYIFARGIDELLRDS